MAGIKAIECSVHYDAVTEPSKPWRLKVSRLDINDGDKWERELEHIAFAFLTDLIAYLLSFWTGLPTTGDRPDNLTQIGNVVTLGTRLKNGDFPDSTLTIGSH